MSVVSDLPLYIHPVGLMLCTARISPRHSPVPSPPVGEAQPSSPKHVEPQKPELEVELDLPTSPPPVEETLAARRAKRQAILAKYAGIASTTLSQGVSPSPGPSSAVEPPPASPFVSNVVSQSHSVAGTPDIPDTAKQVDGASELITW